jgi:hypothetical protein
MGRMPKDEIIIIRIDGETKGRLEQAARSRGLTLSSFLLRAGERAARAPGPGTAGAGDSAPGRGRVRKSAGGACPTFFRALCQEARRGGDQGYAAAGHELTRNLTRLVDGDTPDEVARKMAELVGRIRTRDDPGVIDWFSRELPRCMALVPRRRRSTFLRGVYRMVDEDDQVLAF